MGRILVVLVAGLLLNGAANSAGAQAVTGTALYRERMVLPVGAVFEATLEDVSKADAPADVIGRARMDPPGNPPFKFTIAYDPAKIDQQHRYNVRARITLKDELLFISDRSYPVITGGHPNQVSIVLKMVVARQTAKPVAKPDATTKPPTAGGASGAGAPKTPPRGSAKPAPFVGTHWILTQVGDTAIKPTGSVRDAQLQFASEGSKVTGSTGCNRLTGTYTRNGDALTFGPAATTRMACAPPIGEIENKMLDALRATTTAKITGSELALSDKSGAVVAKFSSR